MVITMIDDHVGDHDNHGGDDDEHSDEEGP